MTDKAPERIGLIRNPFDNRYALATRDEADEAIHYIRLDLHKTQKARWMQRRDEDAERITTLMDERDAAKAEVARLKADLRHIIDERDRTFTLMLARAEKAEAEVARLTEQRDEARDWLAKANNEFGSQTWSWPDLWRRIAQIKDLSHERWERAVKADAEVARLAKERDRIASEWAETSQSNYQRAKKAEADLAALRKAADALAEFSDHDATCERLGGMGVAACICGYDAALAAYRATKGGE